MFGAQATAGLPNGVVITSIDAINPFCSNQSLWIKGRVTDKSDIRTYNNAKGSGKFFNCTVVDESSAIRATFFQGACDKYFPMIVNGSVYAIGGEPRVGNSNRKFSNVNNDYELTFSENKTEVVKQQDSGAIPTVRFNFIPLSILADKEVGTLVDVLVVVVQVSDVNSITQKATGKELTKRAIKLMDMTASVELTVWAETASTWSYPAGTVLACRQVKVGNYDGVQLGTTMSTAFDVAPNIPDVKKLHEWYVATNGKDVKSLSRVGNAGGNMDKMDNFHGRKFFDDIQSEHLGRSEKGDVIEVRCTPIYIKQDAQWYEACPTCNKKVMPAGADGSLHKCEKCDKLVTAKLRYLVSIQASDGVSASWLNMFHETGVAFFGMEPEQLKALGAADPAAIPRIIQKRLHRPILCRIRAKEEKYGGGDGGNLEERCKLTIIRLQELFLPVQVDVGEHPATETERQATQKALSQECAAMLENISLYQ